MSDSEINAVPDPDDAAIAAGRRRVEQELAREDLGSLANWLADKLREHPGVKSVEPVMEPGGDMVVFGVDVDGIKGGVSFTLNITNP